MHAFSSYTAALMRVGALVLGLGLVLVGTGQAQSDEEVSVTAQARPSEVGTAGTVTFEIQIRGASLSAIDTPEPPRTANLVLQESTPVTKRQLSFNSGRLTRRITFAWRFRPMRVGIGRIRAVPLRIKGERYETKEVRVRIVPQSKRPRPVPKGHAQPSASAPTPDPRPEQLGPRDLFIQATASADTVYQNEQVVAEYRLFFRPGIRLRRSRMADAWDASGFWREELDVDARPSPTRTTRNGTTYETIMLKRVALFPTKTGRLTVAPLQIETEARAQPQLGQRNGPIPRSQYESVTLASDSLIVHARPLPPEAPSAFDGAVGQFSMDAQVRPGSVAVGTGIDLTARVQGTGNLATVSPPVVTPPTEVAVYDPTIETTIERDGGGIRGEKTFRFTLVPQAGGRYTLPPVQFAYFDPETEQYEVLRAGARELRVTGEAGPTATSQAASGLPIGDIAGPMQAPDAWIRVDRAPLYAQPWAYAALLVPLVLAAAGVAYRRRQSAAPAASATDETVEEARRRLEAARTHRQNGDVQAFYGGLERTMLTFLKLRLNLPRAASRMTAEDLARELEQYGVADAEREALRSLLDTCNQMQFTPARPTDADMGDALDHTETLLDRLDDALPSNGTPSSA
jgi:hypothetical protein